MQTAAKDYPKSRHRAPTLALLAAGLQASEIEGEGWGVDRSEGIGGSEAGAILGLNPWEPILSKLREKAERKPERTFTTAQRLRMDVGHAVEELALETFSASELGVPCTNALKDLDGRDALVHLPGHLFVNPRHPYAFAHIDGLYRVEGEIGVVDAKVSFRKPWRDVPGYYAAQLAHYCAILGCNVGYIAALFMDPPYPVPAAYRLDFTPEQLERVMEAEGVFWEAVLGIRSGAAPSDADLRALKARLGDAGSDLIAGFGTDLAEVRIGSWGKAR